MIRVATGQSLEVFDVHRLDKEGVCTPLARFDNGSQLAAFTHRDHKHVFIILCADPIEKLHPVAIGRVNIQEDDTVLVAVKVPPGLGSGFDDRRKGKTGLTQAVLERPRIRHVWFYYQDLSHAQLKNPSRTTRFPFSQSERGVMG